MKNKYEQTFDKTEEEYVDEIIKMVMEVKNRKSKDKKLIQIKMIYGFVSGCIHNYK